MNLLLDDAKILIENLAEIRHDRKTIRRILFKFLRENVNVLPENNYAKHQIIRKARNNYLGDFNDKTLIEYSDMIYRRLTT